MPAPPAVLPAPGPALCLEVALWGLAMCPPSATPQGSRADTGPGACPVWLHSCHAPTPVLFPRLQ